MLFKSYLIFLENEDLDKNIEKVKQFTKLNPNNLELIKQSLDRRNIKDIAYIYYLFGFDAQKPDARLEDYLWAIDTYNKFVRFKSRLPQYKHLQPFQLGRRNEELKYALNELEVSNTQKKKLIKNNEKFDESRLITEKFGDYTFYTIPAATNQKEELENKSMYCRLGKATKWCTANPTGDYYKDYVYELNITVIYKDGQPIYQFGLDQEKQFISSLSQFMDIDDEEVKFIPKDLIQILRKNGYGPILNLDQFNDMIKMLRGLKNKENINELLKTNGRVIFYIENPTEEQKKLALKTGGDTMKYIDNASDEIKEYAIRIDPYAIAYIENPTETMQIIAVKKGDVVQYIKNPTELVKTLAVVHSKRRRLQ